MIPKFVGLSFKNKRFFCKHLGLIKCLVNVIETHIFRFILVKKYVFLATFFIAKSNFVTCRLDGQLGNQFFQVAHMLAYAWDNNTVPVFPNINEALGGRFNREYFHKVKNLCAKKEIEKINWKVVREVGNCREYQPIDFYPGININFHGFFISSRYFDKYKNRLLELFQLPEYRQVEIRRKYKNIFDYKNRVAVHIRTGDFSSKQHKIYFPGLDFYCNKMASFGKNTLFVICSDRPGWVKEKFKNAPFNIIYPEADYISEFYLMTQCKHIICSIRSTYSFWAAYLNINSNKKVIAFNGAKNTDWYPEGWIVDTFFPDELNDYSDMKFFKNMSLDNN